MRNQLLLPILFITAFSTSCTPDDDIDMPNPEHNPTLGQQHDVGAS